MAAEDATTISGGAAKLQTWPKSGRPGRAQKPPAATVGPIEAETEVTSSLESC